MKKINYIFSAIIISILVAITAYAETYINYGAGNTSCGEWVNNRKTEKNWMEQCQWMLGFVSAVGYYDLYDLKDTDIDVITIWMDNYCQEHPQEKFAEAVYALVKELLTNKKKLTYYFLDTKFTSITSP